MDARPAFLNNPTSSQSAPGPLLGTVLLDVVKLRSLI